ncbi:hypothetical protein T492DRAFT_1144719 [Pavlovales sp. CCMP2436]|nr:hypothetical protein T492DRAFT_1144719 [Pavlovales sp. CCMP2436]
MSAATVGPSAVHTLEVISGGHRRAAARAGLQKLAEEWQASESGSVGGVTIIVTIRSNMLWKYHPSKNLLAWRVESVSGTLFHLMQLSELREIAKHALSEAAVLCANGGSRLGFGAFFQLDKVLVKLIPHVWRTAGEALEPTTRPPEQLTPARSTEKLFTQLKRPELLATVKLCLVIISARFGARFGGHVCAGHGGRGWSTISPYARGLCAYLAAPWRPRALMCCVPPAARPGEQGLDTPSPVMHLGDHKLVGTFEEETTAMIFGARLPEDRCARSEHSPTDHLRTRAARLPTLPQPTPQTLPADETPASSTRIQGE